MDIGNRSFHRFGTGYAIITITVMAEHEQDGKADHESRYAPVHVAIAHHPGNDTQDEDACTGTNIQHIIKSRTGGTAPFRANHIQNPRQQGRKQQAGT